jgi:2-methylcitrate dehydratase PrpD
VEQTRRAAAFARDLQWGDIPDAVRTWALRCVLDLCGCAIAGSRTRVVAIVQAYVKETFGAGGATVIGSAERTTPSGAALANAFAASAFDLDDGYRPLKGHPGAVVFPAAAAAAEAARASGTEFLSALVAGYELAMRAGRLLHPLYGFYHGSGAWGPIGAAAAAARALGLPAEEVWHAMGIAEFHAPMTPEMRSVDWPSMLKDGIGWGGFVGFASARLAALGFTGIPSLFDSEGAADLVGSLGRDYLMPRVYVKTFAACRWAHPAVLGALTAAAQLGVPATDLVRIRVHTFEAAMHLRGTAPRTTEDAQFSLPWPVACALVDGAVGPDQVLEAALGDPVRRSVAERVEIAHDADLEQAFPERALAWVELEARDGRRARSPVVAAPGDVESPLTDEEVERKFHLLADPVLGAGRAAAVVREVRRLPDAGDTGGLMALLRPG